MPSVGRVADFLGGHKHYWENQKAFFVPNLLCFASEGKTFYYGPIGARFKNWAPWHSTEDRDEIPQDMRTVLNSAERLLNPKSLLEIMQSFVVFSTVKVGEGKPSFKIKILPRSPQYEAAKTIVDRVKVQDAKKCSGTPMQRDAHDFMRFLFFCSFAEIANIKVLTPIPHYL
jgi:type I restriction enzyme R subunit